MSHQADPFLDQLDRYEESLDVTGEQFKHKLGLLIDQRIGMLKQDVQQLRNRFLRGRASNHPLQLANDPLPSGVAVNYQGY